MSTCGHDDAPWRTYDCSRAPLPGGSTRMLRTSRRNVTVSTRRIVAALLLGLTLLSSPTGSPATVQAQDVVIHDHRDWMARVEVIIRQIIVHDDMDWGAGNIKISYNVRGDHH